MAGLCTIPWELFDIICSYLPVWEAKDGCRAAYGAKNEENFRGINSLSLASKGLRYLVEPVLYSTFVKPTNLPWLTGGGPENYTLRYFLRTLLERPELVVYVRTIVLKEWDWDVRHLYRSYHAAGKRQPKQRLARLEQEQIQLYVNASTGLNLGKSRETWLLHLYAGHEDAEIALLLTLASSLEHLAMTMPRSKESVSWPSKHTHYRAVFREALVPTQASKLHTFAHLKQITSLVSALGKRDHHLLHNSLDYLRDFAQLPSMVLSHGSIDAFVPRVSQLSISGDDMVHNMLHWLAGHETSPISWNNDYGRGWESKIEIAALITTYPRLQRIALLVSPFLLASENLRWPFLNSALKYHQSTLQSLTLDTRKSNEPPRISHRWPKMTHLDSLGDMKVLHQLQVHESVMLPDPSEQDIRHGYLVHMLPVTLEELRITGFTGRMLPQLKTVLDHMPNRFPHLVNIKLELEEFELDQETKSNIELEVASMKSGFSTASIEWFETERFPNEILNEG